MTTTLIEGPFGAELLHANEDIAFVEHPIAPRTLAGPRHIHQHEDEYSYVLEGEVGFELGDEVFTAKAGELVAKPRGIWHAFWNPSDEPARILAGAPRATSRGSPSSRSASAWKWTSRRSSGSGGHTG
jgi:uncharacterized cupin superfamily protein